MTFELNDSDKISSILKDQTSVLEPLYWLLEDSFQKGDVQLAKHIYVDFLYFAKYRREDLSQTLKPAYINRLQTLAFELFDNSYKKEQKSVTIKSAITGQELPFKKEYELRDYLVSHPEVLSNCLGSKIKIVDKEVAVDNEYRCDILAEDGEKYYPIELKIGQANHAVVSQIMKYCHYFYMRFRYNFYKPIQGIVCANGYCSWSINELRRQNIKLFIIKPDGENVHLSEIN